MLLYFLVAGRAPVIPKSCMRLCADATINRISGLSMLLSKRTGGRGIRSGLGGARRAARVVKRAGEKFDAFRLTGEERELLDRMVKAGRVATAQTPRFCHAGSLPALYILCSELVRCRSGDISAQLFDRALSAFCANYMLDSAEMDAAPYMLVFCLCERIFACAFAALAVENGNSSSPQNAATIRLCINSLRKINIAYNIVDDIKTRALQTINVILFFGFISIVAAAAVIFICAIKITHLGAYFLFLILLHVIYTLFFEKFVRGCGIAQIIYFPFDHIKNKINIFISSKNKLSAFLPETANSAVTGGLACSIAVGRRLTLCAGGVDDSICLSFGMGDDTGAFELCAISGGRAVCRGIRQSVELCAECVPLAEGVGAQIRITATNRTPHAADIRVTLIARPNNHKTGVYMSEATDTCGILHYDGGVRAICMGNGGEYGGDIIAYTRTGEIKAGYCREPAIIGSRTVLVDSFSKVTTHAIYVCEPSVQAAVRTISHATDEGYFDYAAAIYRSFCGDKCIFLEHKSAGRTVFRDKAAPKRPPTEFSASFMAGEFWFNDAGECCGFPGTTPFLVEYPLCDGDIRATSDTAGITWLSIGGKSVCDPNGDMGVRLCIEEHGVPIVAADERFIGGHTVFGNGYVEYHRSGSGIDMTARVHACGSLGAVVFDITAINSSADERWVEAVICAPGVGIFVSSSSCAAYRRGDDLCVPLRIAPGGSAKVDFAVHGGICKKPDNCNLRSLLDDKSRRNEQIGMVGLRSGNPFTDISYKRALYQSLCADTNVSHSPAELAILGAAVGYASPLRGGTYILDALCRADTAFDPISSVITVFFAIEHAQSLGDDSFFDKFADNLSLRDRCISILADAGDISGGDMYIKALYFSLLLRCQSFFRNELSKRLGYDEFCRAVCKASESLNFYKSAVAHSSDPHTKDIKLTMLRALSLYECGFCERACDLIFRYDPINLCISQGKNYRGLPALFYDHIDECGAGGDGAVTAALYYLIITKYFVGLRFVKGKAILDPQLPQKVSRIMVDIRTKRGVAHINIDNKNKTGQWRTRRDRVSYNMVCLPEEGEYFSELYRE